MKKKIIRFTSVVLCIGTLLSCTSTDNETNISPEVKPTEKISSDVAVKWANMTLKTVYKAPFNTPTYCSRAMGYMGLTMYETIVAGSSEHRSMVGQLNGLNYLPIVDDSKKYNWILSLNAGQSYMLKQLYEQVEDYRKQRIDSLETAIFNEFSKNESPEVVERSVSYGREVAKAIFYGWAYYDGGYKGYERNFDPTYPITYAAGTWRPPIVGQSSVPLPMHPTWGKNRTFVTENSKLPIPTILSYSTLPQSDYYKQNKEVYDRNNKLTQEEKEIAVWWGDDPADTYAPPGHSYNLATIAIKASKPDLFRAAETYARVGIAVADAFINCWKTKYTYFCERPSTFIRSNIDMFWLPFWPEPPFPAFSSGHATQASAAATVMTDLYGTTFKFTDDTHVGRPDDIRGVAYKARSFNSFWETAEESAYSRLLGGIHTRQDNETGLSEGKKIGQNVNALKWKK